MQPLLVESDVVGSAVLRYLVVASFALAARRPTCPSSCVYARVDLATTFVAHVTRVLQMQQVFYNAQSLCVDENNSVESLARARELWVIHSWKCTCSNDRHCSYCGDSVYTLSSKVL